MVVSKVRLPMLSLWLIVNSDALICTLSLFLPDALCNTGLGGL